MRSALIALTCIVGLLAPAAAMADTTSGEYEISWLPQKPKVPNQSYIPVQYTGSCGGQVDGLTCKATERPYCSNGHCHCEEAPECQ